MSKGRFNCLIIPDAKLGAIVGNDPLPPTQMIKKIWDYIKTNNLKVNDKEVVKNA